MEAYVTMRSPVAMGLDKLSYEVFSALENKFLFGGGWGFRPETPARKFLADNGRVRVLAIDGCGSDPGDALLAAEALARLEAALRARAGDPGARVADFFDAAAGAGAGGVLAAVLFLKGPDGRPRYTAEEALAFVAGSLRRDWCGRRRLGLFRRQESSLWRVFGDATLKDTVAPLLVPCYDLSTAAPFLFSRADAVESDSFDFRLRDVCAATCAGSGTAVAVRSVDGCISIAAASGGVAAMGNPTAAAITHVLHNKQEFPLSSSVDDLLVLSISTGAPSCAWATAMPARSRSPSPQELVRLTAEGAANMVDEAVAMAFGHSSGSSYVRIQAAGPGHAGKASRSLDAKKAAATAEAMLVQRNVESVLFRGRKLSERTNAEKLDAFALELAREQERRRRSPLPSVLIKQAATPARLSSATTASSVTATARTVSSMPSRASRDSRR